jgi:hypothetical protein
MHLEHWNLEHDVAQNILDLLAAIIKAIQGPKYENTEEYKMGQINKTLWHNQQWEKQILD